MNRGTRDDGRPDYDAVFDIGFARIGLCFSDDYLTRIEYPENEPLKPAGQPRIKNAQEKIERFISSAGEESIDIPYKLAVSVFQQSVLRELLSIPRGEVRTYGEIARCLKTSARAVGNACRRNPLPLLIPCHRVVAVGGPGGYDGARSGRLLEIKRRLLNNEGFDF